MSGGDRAVLYAHAFLLQVTAYVIRPVAAYQVIELGLDGAYVGLAAASFAVMPLILALWIGRWIDRGKGDAALRVGGVLMLAGGTALLFVGGSIVTLLVWNAVIGLGHLLGILGEQTIVAQSGNGDLDRAFGRYTFVASAGQAVAPLVLSAAAGDGVIPWLPGILMAYTVGCLALTVISFFMRSPQGASSPQRPLSLRAAMSLKSGDRMTMAGAIVASCFVLAAVDLLQVYLPALGVERGVPAWIIGILLSVRAFATMLSRLMIGVLSRRASRRTLIVVSTGTGAVAVGLLALPASVAVTAVLLIVAGLALGIGQPLSMAIISFTAPVGTLATWLAVRLTANRFGQSGVPALMSVVALGSTVSGVFVATGAMLLATGTFAAISLPRR